ncbi:hypothetical protein GGI24_001658, partial [Coemansia furcata]
MSRLPRGPATAGAIRPPTSGLTLPRGLGSKDFLNDVPEMPALTQRIQPGSRRATLTAATFSPPLEGNTTIARSSGFGRAVSPSPGISRDMHSTTASRTPSLVATSSKDASATLMRARARSPAHSFGSLQSIPGHDASKGLALGRGSHPLPRNEDVISSPQRLGSGLRPSSAAGLRCGDPVFIPSQNIRGTLRFLGPIDGKQGTWAGIELDEVGKGKNDGSVAGKSYFVCPPNTGIFAAPSKVEPCVEQQDLTTDTGNRPVSSASSVKYAPEADKSALPVSRPGSTGRIGHSTPVPGGHQRTQGKAPGRSRFASDAQSPASIGMSAINTPASSAPNRRKTMSRIAPLEQMSGQPRPRPPPTVSRGANRARPTSTAESVASNRTTSPQLSRPSSRSVASSIGDMVVAVASPSRQAVTVRSHASGGAIALETSPSVAVPTKRRPAAVMPVRPPEVVGKASYDAQKLKTATTTDPAERLRLRIDMLEAENRVLRLKGEQDKAHLAASHMLARDLATVNGTVSPQLRGCVDNSLRASPHSTGTAAPMSEATDSTGISRQLGEARDQLERERRENRSQIALLVAQIGELKLHSSSTNSRDAIAESEGTCVDEAISAKGNSAEVADLEAKLDMAAQEHAKELLVAKELQAELALELDTRVAANKALLADLDAKTGEAASLAQRLKQADAERLRANQMFKDLVEEHEQKADDSSEKSELVSKLGCQVEKLRQELLESEEQRLNLATGLEVAQGQLSASEAKLAAALAGVAQLQERSDDYDAKCALLSLHHSRMCQLVELAQQYAAPTGGIVANDDLPAAYSAEAVTDLHSKLQAAVMLLAGTARADIRAPDSTVYRDNGDADLQARIDELEDLNDRLTTERDQITLQQTLVNDYLEKLESECNRLVEDIEQLTSENQKLSEDLRMASLQNSTISLDMGALDARLVDEHAGSDGAQPSSTSYAQDDADAT